jgi:hypothetical protein
MLEGLSWNTTFLFGNALKFCIPHQEKYKNDANVFQFSHVGQILTIYGDIIKKYHRFYLPFIFLGKFSTPIWGIT